MKAVELNLATRPFRNDAPIAIALGVMAIAAIAFTAYNAHAYLTADARETVLRESLSDHRDLMAELSNEARQIDAELAEVDVATLESQASFVAAVMQERNFSWTKLFNELERVVPWNVRVSSLRPQFTPGSIDLSILGTAKDDGAFFDFQEVLEAAPNFANVLPTQWERLEGTPDISFTLSVVYLPFASAGESDGAPPDGTENAGSKGQGGAGSPAPAKRVVVEDPQAGAAPAPAAASKPRGTAPRRGTAAPSAGDSAAQSTVEPDRSVAGETSRKTPSAGSPAAAADAAGEVEAGRVTNDFAGSTGFVRTRGDAAPDRGVRTVTRPGETPRPNYDPNNPRNPPEIVRDEQGNPVAFVPRVSPREGAGRVPPTGGTPDLPEAEGSADPAEPATESGGTDDGGSGDEGGDGGSP